MGHQEEGDQRTGVEISTMVTIVPMTAALLNAAGRTVVTMPAVGRTIFLGLMS